VKLAQSGLMRLRLPVPENYVGYVHVGDNVQVRVDALGRSFTGSIVRFTRELNFETRTMETEVDVPNPTLAIDSGMYANVLMRLNHADNVLTIPVGALVLHSGQDEVYFVGNDNHVHIRNVQVGIEGSQLAEIDNGLRQGDRVILGGEEKYHEGEAVTPAVAYTPASETAPQTGGVIDMNVQSTSGGVQ
jgi:RND family efflux transporter MFP subunit